MIRKCFTALLMSFLVFTSNADDTNKVENIYKAINMVASSIVIIKSVYQLVDFVCDSISSNPETELRKELTTRNLENLRAERELNRCLANNENGARENNGLPRACGEVGDFYAAVAGYEALNKIKYAFNDNK
ncbi:hypothetical protein HYX58_00695 [Candidatus Dependentiae bacterium]|nr:hypothetical protein [Candidatus Dependentiae bacterium]